MTDQSFTPRQIQPPSPRLTPNSAQEGPRPVVRRTSPLQATPPEAAAGRRASPPGLRASPSADFSQPDPRSPPPQQTLAGPGATAAGAMEPTPTRRPSTPEAPEIPGAPGGSPSLTGPIQGGRGPQPPAQRIVPAAAFGPAASNAPLQAGGAGPVPSPGAGGPGLQPQPLPPAGGADAADRTAPDSPKDGAAPTETDPLLAAIRRTLVEDLELLPADQWEAFKASTVFTIWREEAPDLLPLPEVLRAITASLPEQILKLDQGVPLPRLVSAHHLLRQLRSNASDFRLPGEPDYTGAMPLMVLPEDLPTPLVDLLRRALPIPEPTLDEDEPVPVIWRVLAGTSAERGLPSLDAA